MSQYIDDAISFFEYDLGINLVNEIGIKYEVLDDIDFFNKCKEETGDSDLSDFLVLAVPKNEEDMNLLLLINDYIDKYQDNYGLEILYSQLSTAYINNIEDLALIKSKYDNAFLRKAAYGIEFWEEYFSIYLTQCVMRDKNMDSEDEDNPYNEKNALKIGLNFLNKSITSSSKTIEQRISLLLYSFGKIVIAKPIDDKKIYNLKPFIANEKLKEPIQNLYSILISKSFEELTLFHFLRIYKLTNKIINVFKESEVNNDEEVEYKEENQEN